LKRFISQTAVDDGATAVRAAAVQNYGTVLRLFILKGSLLRTPGYTLGLKSFLPLNNKLRNANILLAK